MYCKKFNSLFIIFTIIITLSFTSSAYSDEYYVDQNHPQASNSNLGTEASPWKDAWYGAEQLVAGDTLYIKAGYYSRYTGTNRQAGIRPINSGTTENPITIKAYPGDDVYVIGGIVSGIPNLSTSPTLFKNPAIGTYMTDHVIIEGFKVYGAIGIRTSNNITVQNNEIWGGMDGGFGTCIRVEKTQNVRIYNNLARDNVIAGSSEENSVLLIEYDSTNLVIENNEFRNGVSYGVDLKDNPETVTVRYNLIKNCGFGGIGLPVQDQGHEVYIYQNIIKDCEYGVYIKYFAENVFIYNNVIIGPGFKLKATANLHLYNNIVHNNANTWSWLMYNALSLPTILTLDYNNYYGPGTYSVAWASTAATLPAWQQYLAGQGTNFELNSISSDPMFVDPANDDFHLQSGSPAIGAGKNGEDLGVYPNGYDGTIIGLTSGTIETPFVDTTPPAPPTGVTR